MIRKDFHEKVYKKRQPTPSGKTGVKMINLSGVAVTVTEDMRERWLSKGFQLAEVVEAEKKAVEYISIKHPKIPGILEVKREELPKFLSQGFSEVIPDPAEAK
jgi:hypothetical protein